MKKIAFTLIGISFALNQLLAQNKYEKIIYKEVESGTNEVRVATRDIVSNKGLTKFQLKIENKTNFLMVYKPEESLLNLPGGKHIAPKEKWLVIPAFNKDFRVVNFSGPDYLLPQYSFKVDGIYKVSEVQKVESAPDFSLPATANSFQAGSFSCELIKFEKTTNKTSVKFDCRYNGDNVGVINAGRAAIAFPDGMEIANSKQGSSEVVAKGETTRISLVWERMDGGKATDMQKLKLMIKWRDTFVDAVQVKIEPFNVDMIIDESASK